MGIQCFGLSSCTRPDQIKMESLMLSVMYPNESLKKQTTTQTDQLFFLRTGDSSLPQPNKEVPSTLLQKKPQKTKNLMLSNKSFSIVLFSWSLLTKPKFCWCPAGASRIPSICTMEWSYLNS
jgi:hypothetical protein